MRDPITAANLQTFMKALGASVTEPSRVYLVGGATAVLLGWRTSTIDIDLKIIPETEELLRSRPRLKQQLQVNIELASPSDSIPELPGWPAFRRAVDRVAGTHHDRVNES